MASLRPALARCCCHAPRLQLVRPLVADRQFASTSALKLDSPLLLSTQRRRISAQAKAWLPRADEQWLKSRVVPDTGPQVISEATRPPRDTSALPRLTDARSVTPYLFVIAGLVAGIVMVGGATRLTESGLSITEWRPITGTLPPMTEDAWRIEFAKYTVTPEGQTLHKDIAMDDFKRIYKWEYSHRLLGRVIGLAFLLPIPYFALRRRITARTTAQLLGIGTLIGGQGALGWYMVSSGLTKEGIDEAGPHGVARVSQYRLAAHLVLALVIYASCLRLGAGLWRDMMLARGRGVGSTFGNADISWSQLMSPKASGHKRRINRLTGLVLFTACSGGFVAGLDAGLIYNQFPWMGEGFVPPRKELWDRSYARSPDRTDLWRNLTENPVTVQFIHRCLAITTVFYTWRTWRRVKWDHRYLPRDTRFFMKGAAYWSLAQATLGITTLLWLVPTKLAAAHQAGSIVLLTLVVIAGASLRRPSRASIEWMKARGVRIPEKGKNVIQEKQQESRLSVTQEDTLWRQYLAESKATVQREGTLWEK